MKRALEEKRLQIAELKGQIEEYVAKVGVLHSKFEVEKGNVEKTMIETRTLMTSEKEKLSETMKREKDLTQDEHSKVRG